MLKSSLEKVQIHLPYSNEELYEKKRHAWRNGEGIYLNAEQIKNLNITHQWAIEIIGNLVYGGQK